MVCEAGSDDNASAKTIQLNLSFRRRPLYRRASQRV